ncbi:hypothetical protein PIROE2DRAFT_57095 [Piromyces sp. E2]|nr:hypothetical protein PIROE2DRAFT_57095 [Piromyces sp. E2]|eukprot:OUM70047.1 hypothetical protein PIROE2DRAFT_57095 [Piromyces sp. E2]
MSELQTVSYDKIDPLKDEKPFYISEKAYQKIQNKEKKFPTYHILLFALVIPIVSLLMGMIYIGGIWNPIKKIPDLNYIIINHDKGCYTPECAKMGIDKNTNLGVYYQQLDGKGGHFSIISGDRNKAIDMVENHEYWAALYVPENFTINVLMNLNAVNNSTLVPVETELIFDEVRNYTTMKFILKAFNMMEEAFFNSLVKKFEEKGSFNPLFIIEGIHYKEINLHKVNSFGQNFSSFIFLLIIWIGTIATSIISHFYFPFENHWVEKKDTKHPILKAMITKISVIVLINIVIDVISSVIPFFCGTFEIEHGYWKLLGFLLFFSLSGLGVNNLLIHILPFIFYYFTAITFMFLQLLSCGGLLDNDVQPEFFKIGKAFPMFYGVRETRYLYWGSGKQYRTENFLVIGIWAIVSIIGSLYMYYLELCVKRKRFLKRNEFIRKN